MKRLFIIEDSRENKISYYHLLVLLITLPFDKFYSELALISFIIHVTIHITKARLRNAFNVQTLLSSSIFLITAAGLLYSSDKTDGLKDLEKQLALILFPFALACSGLDLKKYMMNLLLLFSFTCVIVVLYLYFDALHIIIFDKLPITTLFTQAFINHNFSEPIALHATYFAMYCLLSAIVLFNSFLNEANRGLRIIYLFSVLILLAAVLQLGSRSVLISGIIIALIFPFILLKGSRRVKVIVMMLGVLIAAGLLISNIASFNDRYIAQFKEDLSKESVTNEISEPRIVRWQYILKLIEKSPLTGYGSGSERRMLDQAYFENKLYTSYLLELNAHNQYLGIALETGAWGLIVFLLTLLAGFIAGLRQKNILLISFIVIISIVSFSENVLDVNKGIFFYAFFFSLFIQSGKPFEEVFRFKRKLQPGAVNKTSDAAVIRSNNYL